MGLGKGHSRDGNPWRKHNLLGGGMVELWVLPHPTRPPMRWAIRDPHLSPSGKMGSKSELQSGSQ